MHSMKRVITISASLLVICLIYSCGSDVQKAEQTKTVFRYNESAGITSLDPAFSRSIENIWAVNQLFNGLVQMDDNLNVKPCIAKSWEISDDGLMYTFHLRNDVFFHDHPIFKDSIGRKVVASDFVNSFLRLTSPEIASPGEWIFNNIDKSLKSNYLGFVATNDSTLQIYLQKAFPPFLGLLTMQYCSVVPQEVVDFYGNDFRNHPIGTGPFRFKIWKENEKLIFVKNDSYFEKDGDNKLPYLDAVSISFIKDRQSSFLEFIKGNFDFLSGIDGTYKDDVLSKEGKLSEKYVGKINLDIHPYLKTDYLGIVVDEQLDIVKNSPLKLKAIRQAINYGFDRQKMIGFLRNNIGKAATAGFVPKGMPGYEKFNVKGYTYNPDMARELLTTAGFPEGKGLPEIKLVTTSMYLDLCEFIQSELKEIGINLKVEVLSPAIHSEMVARQGVNFFRKSWVADYPDAENYLALFYSKNFAPEGPNYTHFKNAKFDGLYEQAQTETDEQKRYEYYGLMDQIIIEESPIVPLYYDEAVVFYHNNISGLSSNPLNLLSLKKVKKALPAKP